MKKELRMLATAALSSIALCTQVYGGSGTTSQTTALPDNLIYNGSFETGFAPQQWQSSDDIELLSDGELLNSQPGGAGDGLISARMRKIDAALQQTVTLPHTGRYEVRVQHALLREQGVKAVAVGHLLWDQQLLSKFTGTNDRWINRRIDFQADAGEGSLSIVRDGISGWQASRLIDGVGIYPTCRISNNLVQDGSFEVSGTIAGRSREWVRESGTLKKIIDRVDDINVAEGNMAAALLSGEEEVNLHQKILTKPGQRYQISFDVSAAGGNTTVEAWWGPTLLAVINADSLQWKNYTFYVDAVNSHHYIRFIKPRAPDDVYALIDDVRIYEAEDTLEILEDIEQEAIVGEINHYTPGSAPDIVTVTNWSLKDAPDDMIIDAETGHVTWTQEKRTLTRFTLVADAEYCGLQAERTIVVRPAGGLPTDNIKFGETISYPLAYLSGTLEGINEGTITLSANGESSSWPVYMEKYKGMVKLKPGLNDIVAVSGDQTWPFQLTYEPPEVREDGRLARLFFYIGKDGTGEIDAEPGVPNDLESVKQRMSLNALLMQSFFAETYKRSRERQQGLVDLPRETFHFELDDNQMPIVRVIRDPDFTQQQIWDRNDGSYDRYRAGLFAKQWNYKWIPPEELWDWTTNLAYARSGISHLDPETGVYHSGVCLGGSRYAMCHAANLSTHAMTLDEVSDRMIDLTKYDNKYIVRDTKPGIWQDTNGGAYTATMGKGLIHEFGHVLALGHDNTGMMSSDGWHINRFFVSYEPRADGSKLLTTHENEAGHKTGYYDWWHPDSVEKLERSPYIY